MNIFIMNRYISKSYTRSKNTIYIAGAAVESTITSITKVLESRGFTLFTCGIVTKKWCDIFLVN